MADFANTLSKLFKDHNFYAVRVAEASGVDRSLLSKVLKNSRPLPYSAFKKILNVLNISYEEYDSLLRAYIDEYFGYDKYCEYLKILKKFSSFDDRKEKPVEYRNILVDLDFNNDVMALSTENEIINIARQIISYEIEKTDGKVYSNIPTGMMTELMRYFPDKLIDFKYIIDNFLNEDEKLFTLSDVLSLMHYGYVSNYSSSSKHDLHLNLLFPHYIITSGYILLMDLYTGSGFLCRNSAIIERYSEVFLKKFDETTPYIKKYNDIMMLKEVNSNVFSRGIGKPTFFHSFGCFSTAFLELDMWEQIAKPDVPNREFLRDTTYMYYKSTYGAITSNLCNISSRESLAEFVDFGIVKSMPREFAYPLNRENRVRILEEIYKSFQPDDMYFYLYDDSGLKLGSDFGIELYDNPLGFSHMTLYYPTENCQLHFCGNLSFLLDDTDAIHDFSEFINCFILSDYCYTKEKSLEILKEEILRCKMLPDN